MIEFEHSDDGMEAVEVDVANVPSLPPALPVLPLRETVAFPDTVTPLAVGQERSVHLVNDALGGNRMIVMVASKDSEDETPGPDKLYDVGVVGVIARMIKVADGTLRLLVQSGQRVIDVVVGLLRVLRRRGEREP